MDLVPDEDDRRNACLVARTEALLKQYEQPLEERGITCRRLTSRRSDDPNQPGLRTATMHRVKGLEFDHVIVAGANADVNPLPAAMAHADSDHALREAETRERSLLYVAATRARKQAVITCHGTPSTLLPGGAGTDSSLPVQQR